MPSVPLHGGGEMTMSDETNMDTTGATDEATVDEAIATALDEAVMELSVVRGLMHEIVRRNGALADQDPRAWAHTNFAAETVMKLGHVVNMLDATRATAGSIWATIIQTAATNESTRDSVEPLAEAFATGMTESALSCLCGLCPPCALKNARGEEVARPEVLRRMKATIVLPAAPKARVVLARG